MLFTLFHDKVTNRAPVQLQQKVGVTTASHLGEKNDALKKETKGENGKKALAKLPQNALAWRLPQRRFC